ncbi:MAG: Holliday junction resolvase RuvX [bacterium]|nr:Holliday junction resolvase RuvX [bacterium]MDD4557807.1 Holliday junction resolvase RuvX [bacterium]
MNLKKEKRILGLDIGDRRIGVAVSDELMLTAQPVEVIHRALLENDLESIAKLADMYDVRLVVVGMPLMLDRTVGRQAEKVQQFVEKLKKRLDIPVETIDERLSTSMAERVMIDAGVRRKKRRQHIDALAAAGILQVFIDRLRNMPEHSAD